MMLGKIGSGLLTTATALLLLAAAAAHSKSELETVGLAVYTDTARDIYMAGLLLPANTDLETIEYSPGPKAMEYRIATRRISSRGFSGTLLLQAELGSQERAPDEVVTALAGIKQAIQGSLVQGDQFIILLSESDATSFYLNNKELLTIDNPLIFNFLFSGWIGQSSSALMRDSLLSGQLDTALLMRYESLAPSEARMAAVASWGNEAKLADASGQTESLAPPEQKTSDKKQPGTVSKPQQQLAKSDTAATASAAAATAAAATAAAATAAVATAAVAQTGDATTAAATAPANAVDTTTGTDNDSTSQVAALDKEQTGDTKQPAATTEDPVTADAANAAEATGSDPEQVALLDQPAEAPGDVVPLSAAEAIPIPSEMDDREYQRELNRYVGTVIRKVFSEVRYPRRAVDKNKQGNVELLAYMDEDGELLDVTLDSSSGFGPLDKAAIKAVKKAAPFPELSDAAKEEFLADDGMNYVMLIPVKFILQD